MTLVRRWALPLLSAPTLVSCLAFKDFDLVEESAGSGASSSGEQCAGPYECINDVLRSCESGERETLERCRESGKWCNADLGRCTTCRVGDDLRCVGEVLETCGPGGEFEVAQDCGAQGMYCTPAAQECVPCITGRKYCVDAGPDEESNQLYSCRNYQIPEDRVTCPHGCVQTEAGEGQCANCPVSGEVFCSPDGTELLLCPMDRTLTPPTERECPNGCDPDEAEPECEPEP